ncbi:PDR/VanB family oxidoreductase [Herbiconiux sp. KACC 21604]|uniref:PDR/VanB family oxidoreductase n=1 Tax=unclassified Herbiconiux TaxID=2618217 RepID=UPI001491CB00|nr:PDR/VanB family oxidoreductase [Herbiconiux sp. SALV-R1]QJU54026.1 oxidoreductase [Herbiconiux sp. SALV-R1]WPO85061.1 PDR/VanB family oxidoreductase [Herbiconiux sp. KACC 21604]
MTGVTLTEIEAVVTAAEMVATDVVLLTLRAADGSPLPAWTPGAHLDVEVQPGVERQYSLCGDPADRSVYRVAVLREPDGRGGSLHLHAHVAEGSTLRVRGPLNHFALSLPPASTPLLPHYVFVAGGIGITPILPMVHAVAAAGVSWELHYAGRSLERMPFVDELVTSYGSSVSVYTPEHGRRLDLSSLDGGSVSRPVAVYSCGPARMLAELEEVASAAAWPSGTLHLERFEAKQMTEPVRHEAFEVELELSGLTVEVPPDRSILDVVEEAGVLVLSSCREGTCGTCETPVVSGEVDHRDSVLTPDEQEANEVMMICVSRAACPRLVLEI